MKNFNAFERHYQWVGIVHLILVVAGASALPILLVALRFLSGSISFQKKNLSEKRKIYKGRGESKVLRNITISRVTKEIIYISLSHGLRSEVSKV